jgi:hypothetical protein
MTQVYAAAQNGRPDVAATLLKDRAAAMRNSGNEKDAKAAETMAEWATSHPESFKTTAGLMLSSAMGPDKFATTFATLGDQGRAAEKAPSELKKSEADAAKAGSEAKTAAVTAKYADSAAVAELEKKGWDVKALQAEIEYKKQSSRIAAMNAAISREGNDLKRQELKLKIDEAITARDTKVREKVSDYESQRAQLEDGFNLVNEIRNHPGLGGAIGKSAFMSAIPGTDARTAAGKIEQLSNTLAATNLDKLKGAMSDKDIMFLKNIGSNLDRYQGEEAFKKELAKIEDVFVRNEKMLRKKFGAPTVDAATPQPAAGTPRAPGQKTIVVDW